MGSRLIYDYKDDWQRQPRKGWLLPGSLCRFVSVFVVQDTPEENNCTVKDRFPFLGMERSARLRSVQVGRDPLLSIFLIRNDKYLAALLVYIKCCL